MDHVLPADPHAEIREEVAKLCARFPGDYWRKLDQVRGYPTEFVQALTEGGYLAALIPEEFGGAGLPLSAAAAILETIHATGCNGADAVAAGPNRANAVEGDTDGANTLAAKSGGTIAATAAANPAIAGTGGVPPRRPRSCPPPRISAVIADTSGASSSAPAPIGPPSLCEDSARLWAPRSARSTGMRPAACAASTCNSAP